MGDLTIKTRIKNKNAKEASWETSSLVPLAGEVVVYNTDSSHSNPRIKVGDGQNSVSALPFIDADSCDHINSSSDDLSASLDDTQGPSSDILWSSKKTYDKVKEMIDETAVGTIGVKFSYIDGNYVGTRIGNSKYYSPGYDYNTACKMYRDRKLVDVDLSDNQFTIQETFDDLSEVIVRYNAQLIESMFVQQPKFYYKIEVEEDTSFSLYLSDTAVPGFTIHPTFSNADGKINDYIYIAKGCISGTCSSVEGDTKYTEITVTDISCPGKQGLNSGSYSISRDECRRAVKAYNSKLDLYDIWALSASQMLFMVEYATLDIQSIIGEGEVRVPHPPTNTNYNIISRSLCGTAKEAIAIKGDNLPGYKKLNDYGTYTYRIDLDTNDAFSEEKSVTCVDASYRWESNLWGGPFRICVDGMNVKSNPLMTLQYEYSVYVCKDRSKYADDKTGDGFEVVSTYSTAITPSLSGFPLRFNPDLLKQGLFFGDCEMSSTSTSGLPDYSSYYNNLYHCTSPYIGCVYNWEVGTSPIIGGPGLFQYEIQNQISSQTDKKCYNNYSTAKVIYVPR